MTWLRAAFQDELDGVTDTLVELSSIVSSAIDITLIGRYYERFADHAVSVARRVYYLVTGKFANN